MRHVRYGIIGSGMMGQEHIRNISLLDGAEVVAVADPNEEMRSKAALTAGPGCVAFDGHMALLDSGKCDAIVLAAPNFLHHPILADVLPTDIPLLVEKPLGIDGPQCRDIVSLAGLRRAPVWVAMEYRYMPPIARLLDEVRAGTVGAPRMIAIREHRFPFLSKVDNWNRFQNLTGGTMVEKCCHFFDLMRLVAGSDATRVYASGAMDVNFRSEDYNGNKADIMDNAFVIVDFANGIRGMLDLCMFAEGSYWQETVSVTGDVARIDAFVPGPARFSTNGEERPSQIAISSRADKVERREDIHVDAAILSAGDHHGSTYFQHQKFLALVREGGQPEVSLDDGLKAVEIGAAAEESARSGMPVAL
jgi:predicted dehydrogenase